MSSNGVFQMSGTNRLLYTYVPQSKDFPYSEINCSEANETTPHINIFADPALFHERFGNAFEKARIIQSVGSFDLYLQMIANYPINGFFTYMDELTEAYLENYAIHHSNRKPVSKQVEELIKKRKNGEEEKPIKKLMTMEELENRIKETTHDSPTHLLRRFLKNDYVFGKFVPVTFQQIGCFDFDEHFDCYSTLFEKSDEEKSGGEEFKTLLKVMAHLASAPWFLHIQFKEEPDYIKEQHVYFHTITIFGYLVQLCYPTSTAHPIFLAHALKNEFLCLVKTIYRYDFQKFAQTQLSDEARNAFEKMFVDIMTLMFTSSPTIRRIEHNYHIMHKKKRMLEYGAKLIVHSFHQKPLEVDTYLCQVVCEQLNDSATTSTK